MGSTARRGRRKKTAASATVLGAALEDEEDEDLDDGDDGPVLTSNLELHAPDHGGRRRKIEAA